MRNPIIYIIIVLISFLYACTDPNAIPTDLEDKKAYVIKKNEEIRALEVLVNQVSAEIEELEPKEERRTSVLASPLERKDFRRYVDLQGSVISKDAVYASSEMGGRIKHLYVEEGDYVHKGNRIANIDLETISKQIEEVQTSLDLASDVFMRQENLWKQNIGSEVQFLQAKNNKERFEKTLSSLQFQLSKADVSAPISGYVDIILTKEGEVCGPGTPIVQIINTKQVKVIADIPESYLGVIKKGDKVGISFPALNTEREAKVTMLGRTIDASNRTFKVEVNLNNVDGSLKPNLLAMMKVNDLTIENVIIIPIELVQQEVSGKDYVYIIEDKGTDKMSKKVYIETSESAKGEIVVVSGLEGTETIITQGARGLTNGELIEIVNNNEE